MYAIKLSTVYRGLAMRVWQGFGRLLENLSAITRRPPYRMSATGMFNCIWIFFHEHAQFTGQQGKGEAFSLTPCYHIHPFYRYLDISQVITVKSSPLHIAGNNLSKNYLHVGVTKSGTKKQKAEQNQAKNK